jgi:hypothetical protein
VKKSLSIVLFLVAACDLASAMEVPLPRAKPLPVANSPSRAPLPEVLPLHDAEAWPSDCALRLAEIARFANEPTLNGPGQCGASDVVRLEGIMMPNSALVTVMPTATLRCPMAEAVAQWVRNDLGPAMAELESPLASLTTHGSYECRGRNNAVGAKISEHGRGNALDLGPVRLANGSIVDLRRDPPRDYFASAFGMRPAAASLPCLGRDQTPIMPSTFTSTWRSEHTAIGCASGIYESLKLLLKSRSRSANRWR